MKFTTPLASLVLFLPLFTLTTASPDHASAMRIFRRAGDSFPQKRDAPIPQGLFKRQLNQCVDPGYDLCPSSDFCCPPGLTCVEGGWCGDESLTTCYAGEDDCGTHCCLVGYKCIAGSTDCQAVGGSSSSSSSSSTSSGGSSGGIGVDVTSKQKNTKAGKSSSGKSNSNSNNGNGSVQQPKSAGNRVTVGCGMLGAVAGVAALML